MMTGGPNPRERSKSRPRRDSFLSSGRGGSGNIRRLKEGERPLDPITIPVPPLPGRPGSSNGDKFFSSGRGGSGNIKPTSPDLDSHPLTAEILSQHTAIQAQYEEQIRKVYAEAASVRSSGRGGSGNIKDPRKANAKANSPKKSFFRRGRSKAPRQSDSAETESAKDEEIVDCDKRQSRDTFISGSSIESGHSGSSMSNLTFSSSSVVPNNSEDSLPSDDVSLSGKPRRSFMIRFNKPPRLSVPVDQDDSNSPQSSASRPTSSPISLKSRRRSDGSMPNSMPPVAEDGELPDML